MRVIQQSLLQVCTDGPEGTKIFPTICQVFLGPMLLCYYIPLFEVYDVNNNQTVNNNLRNTSN